LAQKGSTEKSNGRRCDLAWDHCDDLRSFCRHRRHRNVPEEAQTFAQAVKGGMMRFLPNGVHDAIGIGETSASTPATP
jgi:hypothetical protein